MSVRTEFVFSSADGSEKFPTLHEWVKTLIDADQTEFYQSEIRQFNYRQEAIDRGDMIVDPDNPVEWFPGQDLPNPKYIWKDEETAAKGKEHDEIWLHYWNRYLAECNVKFEVVVKKD
jgi:hypothetical protein